jgi:hypothetical protein
MEPLDSPAPSLHRAFERPAQVVATVARMLLGLGLAVALALKVYMAIFTDHVCLADADTLGNAIRCTPSLAMVAQALMLAAGFGAAAVLFSARPHELAPPLLIAVVAVFLQLLSGLAGGPSPWQAAILVTALLAVLAAVFLAMRLPQRPPAPAPSPARAARAAGVPAE